MKKFLGRIRDNYWPQNITTMAKYSLVGANVAGSQELQESLAIFCVYFQKCLL